MSTTWGHQLGLEGGGGEVTSNFMCLALGLFPLGVGAGSVLNLRNLENI